MSLKIENVTKIYAGRRGIRGAGASVTALENVSLDIGHCESVGLVGEAGSGKSTLTRLILRLEPPASGRILYDGRDLARLKPSHLRLLRAKIQIVYRDPYASLNPRMTIHDIVAEPMVIHRATLGLDARRRTLRVVELLERVGLGTEHVYRFPHEFSGGQRQRICIAPALASGPELLLLDEPTSALDVSVQAQVLNMLFALQRQLGLTYLFISHDLGVIRYVADRVVVIFRGRIVEEADAETLFSAPKTDYAKILLAAVPEPDPDKPLVRP
jgi:ABC-type glutathione transport system ATPase component